LSVLDADVGMLFEAAWLSWTMESITHMPTTTEVHLVGWDENFVRQLQTVIEQPFL
jgi:hypothetical protein